MADTRTWAREEFGKAELGDARRTRRLVRIAAAFAERPSGLVTRVMQRADEREGAFRFIENDQVEVDAIAHASHLATARRLVDEPEITVPLDQASLTITDRVGKPGFGRVGPSAEAGRGFQVMTALAVGPDGATEGILGQQWWAREEKSPEYRRDKRPPEQRESDLWRRTLLQAEQALAAASPGTRAWYQLDRGADSAAVLTLAVDNELRLTVRSAYNRALGDGRHLHTSMRRRRLLGTYSLHLPKTPKRSARSAKIALRAAPVELKINDPKGRLLRTVQLWSVHVRERRPPHSQQGLEWWLLTTKPTKTFDDALLVVRNYTMRWRIEEFHRAWKSGVCDIESSQLRSSDTFKRWATISAAVAARAERLKLAARTEPDRPATDELSRDEIDAAILLSPHRGYSRGAELTLEQAVRLIADLGGYTGKSSGGPPGTRVIQRGLEQVLAAARIFEGLRRSD